MSLVVWFQFVCFQWTFGVSAWKSWVAQKNAEIEEISSTNKKIKPMKTEILQLNTDELNFSLCMFVKEVGILHDTSSFNIYLSLIHTFCL